jgi:hypothetical protein
MDHSRREDAPGADAGDGSAPGAPDGPLRAVAGLDASGRRTGAYVDVYDRRHPSDILHVPADEFAAFVARAKAGGFDHLVPDELKPPAGPPPEPGRAP